MPIPWPVHFVPSAIAIGVPAGICGGLVGAFVARALGGSRQFTLPVGRWWPGAVGAVGFAALLAFCLPTHPPAGATATVTLTPKWKSLIRIQPGRERADVPVYLPADPAIPATGVAAVRHIMRALIADTTLMQRERKRDVPGWLWSTATLAVLSIIAVLVAIIVWGLNRVAVLGAGGSPPSRVRRAWSRPAPAGAGR